MSGWQWQAFKIMAIHDKVKGVFNWRIQQNNSTNKSHVDLII